MRERLNCRKTQKQKMGMSMGEEEKGVKLRTKGGKVRQKMRKIEARRADQLSHAFKLVVPAQGCCSDR